MNIVTALYIRWIKDQAIYIIFERNHLIYLYTEIWIRQIFCIWLQAEYIEDMEKK